MLRLKQIFQRQFQLWETNVCGNFQTDGTPQTTIAWVPKTNKPRHGTSSLGAQLQQTLLVCAHAVNELRGNSFAETGIHWYIFKFILWKPLNAHVTGWPLGRSVLEGYLKNS